MYHFYDVVINDTTGVPLSGVIIRLYSNDVIVPLFADAAGTVPIQSVSGIANGAVSDGAGNYDFYVADGTYDIRFFVGDAVLKILPAIQMVVAASTADVAGLTTALNGKVGISTLALGTGASGVGYTAPSGGSLQTQDAKNRQIIDPRDYGAIMDGATNDRSALIAADAVGPVRISRPVYVATSMTFTNPPEFIGNGRIVGPSSATITVPGDINAQRRLVFDGVSVSGLIEAWLEWFANDVKTTGATVPATDATARMQRAVNALTGGGTLYAGAGNWRIDGTTAVSLNQGQSFWGAGYGPRAGTSFYWSSTTRNLFNKTDLGQGTRGATIGNFRAVAINGAQAAVSSSAIYVNQSDVIVRDVVTEGAYNGVVFDVSYISRVFNVACYESVYSGVLIKNSLDVFVDKWNVSADDILVTTGTPSGGAFTLGETVNHPGSSGTITKVYSNTEYRVRWLGVAPSPSAAITATGKSATMLSTSIPHQGGMIRIEGTCESVVIGDGDGIGGLWGLYQSGTGAAGRVAGNSGYNVIKSGAYFDSTYNGSFLSGAYGTVIDGWFATARSQDAVGLDLVYCRQISGKPRVENNAGVGIRWTADSQQIYIAPKAVGNGRNTTLGSECADVYISGAASNFGIDLVDGFCGFAQMNGAQCALGLNITGAGSGNFSIIGSGVPVGKVKNSSTAGSQYWFGVPGVPWRVDPAGLPNAANDAAAAAAFVPVGGLYRNGSVMMIRVS